MSLGLHCTGRELKTEKDLLELHQNKPFLMAALVSFGPTNLNPVRADVKDANHSGDESTNGPEVETSNTPGAIDQKHNVGLCFGLARHI